MYICRLFKYNKMELKDILSISGKSGLFKLVTSAKNHIIIQSIVDGKRSTAFASHKISSLEDISIYTYEDDIPLSEVFDMIFKKENGEKAINHKSTEKELRAYMTEVMPDYDEDRVYSSDLRKLFQWYNLLHDNDLLIQSDSEESEKNSEEEE